MLARRPLSERGKNSVLALSLVASLFVLAPLGGPWAMLAFVAGNSWLTWRHFKVERARRGQSPIRWTK
jgi:hypothetical protein